MTPNNDATHESADVQALGHSPDARQQRQQQLLELLRQTAPEVLSDNQIDVERLKELLGEERLAPAEHYELSWAGKKDARREIQKKTSHTLRPDANNPESAQHMLIEGENLEVLRVLQKSYYGKVKMIYIDPPYNTGNDSFVYPDDYSETLDEYQKRTGEKNEAGFLNKQSLWKKNSKESGQYHSAWLSMMYPRLYLARNLLREDGVIFISIDDNEAANLKLLCDEVFGEENFLGVISNTNNPKGRSDDKFIATAHEYVFSYSRNISLARFYGFDPEDKVIRRYNKVDDKGKSYREMDLRKTGDSDRRKDRPDMFYYFYYEQVENNLRVSKTQDKLQGEVEIKPVKDDGSDGRWRWGFGTAQEKIDTLYAKFMPTRKIWGIFEKDYLEGRPPVKSTSSWTFKDVNSERGSEQFIELGFGKEVFQRPKPIGTIKRCLEIGTIPDEPSIVLDFFAGSGSTAQAVFELNKESKRFLNLLLVQFPEGCDENSEAYQAGYRTIADITRARIEKVIAKLKAEHPEKTAELACAHFTLAPSNFKVWNSELNDPGAIRQQLDALQNTEKHADEQTAMLTELLLKNGLGALGVHAVSKPRTLACGVTVHRVLREDDRYLWLCFEPYVAALRDEIVSASPAQVIMLNSCFVSTQGDEQLSNLQLELAAQDINLLVI